MQSSWILHKILQDPVRMTIYFSTTEVYQAKTWCTGSVYENILFYTTFETQVRYKQLNLSGGYWLICWKQQKHSQYLGIYYLKIVSQNIIN